MLIGIAADPTTIAHGAPLAELAAPLKKICQDHLVQWFGHLLRRSTTSHGGESSETGSSDDGSGGGVAARTFVGVGDNGDIDSSSDSERSSSDAVADSRLTHGFIAKLHSSTRAYDVKPVLLVNRRDSRKRMRSPFAAGGAFQAQTRLNVTDGKHIMLAVVATQAILQGDFYDEVTIIKVERYTCYPCRPDPDSPGRPNEGTRQGQAWEEEEWAPS